jgi:hypothetical protein
MLEYWVNEGKIAHSMIPSFQYSNLPARTGTGNNKEIRKKEE